jgi:hypothetical protein
MTKKPPKAEEAEAEARAINTEPWDPMPGMVKRLCPQCRYFFASPADSTERRCPGHRPPPCPRTGVMVANKLFSTNVPGLSRI